MSYNNSFKEIEKYSKNVWKNLNVYKTKIDNSKEKMVILDFFPYPSGVGLHVGHTLGYIATDIYSRFQRLKGKNVLHSMGYDAFGLPAEQFAIENNEHPSIITYKNISNIKSQLEFLGLDHDNERTFNTTDIDYYKWTQFIFLRLYNSYFDKIEQKAKPIENLIVKLKDEGKSQNEIDTIIKSSRLAYLDEIKVNWCPKLGTVLSNEEVIGGLSERGSYPVFQKPLKQWVLKITEYSQRLVDNLDLLDWPESVKEMQRNWIGISNGHEISFKCNNGEVLKVYTTRLETLNGVVALCLSREHPKLNQFFDIMQVSEIEKLPEKFKGIKSKITALHPMSNQKIAIFVADYVLPYGTCAVMSVPAHDNRDYNFAKENNLEIIPVIAPDSNYLKQNNITLENYKNNTANYPCYSEKNILLNGNTIEQEIIKLEKNTDFIEKKQYTKLRDWIFSRQRYWGEPFPIILDKNGEPYSLEDEALPVELPYLEKIKAESIGDIVYKPLDDCVEWKNVKFIKLDNKRVRVIKDITEAQGKEIFEGIRETNTMPNWAGSCWYYLRYMDNKNDKEFIGTEAKNYWETPKKIGSVDLYLGGTEHAVLHLMYARFWHMVLYGLGYLNSPEPFQKLFNQGMILGPSYKNEAGKYFSYKNVEKRGNDWYSKDTNEKLEQNIGKIGKRYKNGVTPEEVCEQYSIDGLRLFMMHLGPLDQSKPWDYTAIKGMVRLLDNVYHLEFEEGYEDAEKIKHEFNVMLSKIDDDFEVLKFNTAISAFIIFINFLHKEKCKLSLDLYKKLLIILSPMAIHLCEYLYGKINVQNRFDSIVNENWPKLYENVKYIEDSINLVITIDGKKPIECAIKVFISKEEVNKFVENYCIERKIIFNKIIVFFNKNSWYSNIVTL